MKRIYSAAIAFVAMVLSSCGYQQGSDRQGNYATTVAAIQSELYGDSLLESTFRERNYDRVLLLADSLQQAQVVSEATASYWSGRACVSQHRYRVATYYYKKVVDSDGQEGPESKYYTGTVCNLTNLLLARGDYEEAMRTAMPAVTKLRATGKASAGELADLLTYIGFCQTKLGRFGEAAGSLKQALGYYEEAVQTDTVGTDWQNYVLNAFNTSVGYKDVGRYEESLAWCDRADSLLHRYAEQPFAQGALVDYFKGSIELNRAVALQKLHRNHEAAYAYSAFRHTNFGNSMLLDINAVTYLVDAQRYQEAADAYKDLDHILASSGFRLTLDNIQQFYTLKFRANMGAGRRDSALAVGMKIVDALDSAIVWQKHSDASELATVYDTQQKETEIARQQAEIASQDAALSYQRWIGTAVAMILMALFFVIYTIYRNKMHRKLQTAYDQLEETTTAKERIESELRIARDIQMSMVPHEFPQRPDLDLYASMTPAREVGGDLYEYLLDDDRLYFCVGDVSGKGVPASLFMAQAVRLFRILASQRVAPADMATQMNAALSEDNEQGMFVTMFIGLVHLPTGHLDFCNAGHNPPVLTGEEKSSFLQMETNAPIGLWPELKFVGEEIESMKRQSLFVYTDGLNEAENSFKEQFGEDRLLAMVKEVGRQSSRQVIEALETAVTEHRGGSEPNDDLTMMCVRVC